MQEERKKAEKAAKLTAMAGAFGGKLNDKDAGRRKEEEERKKKEAEEKARAEAEAAAKAPARLDSRTKEMMSCEWRCCSPGRCLHTPSGG